MRPATQWKTTLSKGRVMFSVVAQERPTADYRRRPSEVEPGHLVVLTNYIPPHARPLFDALNLRCEKLTILISTEMEGNRHWRPDWGSLDVRRQNTWTFKRPWRHPQGFEESLEIHIPRDTIGWLKRLQPDAIVSEQFGCRSLLSGLYKTFRRRVPLVYLVSLSEHTEQGRGLMRRVLRKWLARKADCVGVNGSSGERYLHELGVPRDRTSIVPYTMVPGVFDQVRPTRPPESAHRLLYSGQFIELKGLVQFTTALSRWAAEHPHRRVEFNLVGYGPERQAIADVETPTNLSLRFLGKRSFHELGEVYGQHGVLVLPTLSDEWGMVVNEAMTAGMPVLGSRYSQAVTELCVEGETGWTFRPDHDDELVDAIDATLNTSVDRLNEMRSACREKVAPITPEYAAEQLLGMVRTAKRINRRGTK
jgi:glycosyltransferase involved in cell wall biosynthesis